MITSIQNRAMIGKVLAVGFLLATLVAMLLSTTPPAGAAVPTGKAFSWGVNFDGQLGNDTSGVGTDTNTPGAVKNLEGVKGVKAGCNYSLALKTDGTVYAWGDNFYGQLGNGTSGAGTDSDVPVKVKIKNVKAISAGCHFSLALKSDGTVYAWGDNFYGQLGNGTSGVGTESNVPAKVAILGTGAKGVAAGENFSLALMKDGTVKSWGDNYYGQLGNGTSGNGTNKTTPVAVVNLSNVKAIATDIYAQHALALLNDGTVKSWGLNYAGQLGNGSSLPGTKRSKPVRVANLSGVEAVATGANHSLALLSSGKVKSWGDNHYGQLGNGTSGADTNRSTPGNVTGLENVRSVSGGAFHSLAILESGRARSWGYNAAGELGNGATGGYSDVPGAVRNLSNVVSIDGGYEFTLAATQ